jgi:HSP20 family protein
MPRALARRHRRRALRVAHPARLPVRRVAHPGGPGARVVPAIDVVREDGSMIIRADVPGSKPEDVKIEVEDDILTIRAVTRSSASTTCAMSAGAAFSRSIALPADAEAEQIKASTRDGVSR